MSRFGWVAHKVIEKSDIILEVLDARFVKDTTNKDVERKVKAKNKILIQVINKADYVDSRKLDSVKKKLINGVVVSVKDRVGLSFLRNKIKILANKNKMDQVVVGVVGYPNVGKSSLINVLKGRRSAKISSEAGFTKGEQYVRISRNILMIDTPGVMTKEIRDEEELVLIGAKNPHTIKDPDMAVMKLMQEHPDFFGKKYNVKVKDDLEATIEEIALKLNLKKKGNMPDIERASRKILKDWLK